jgi:cytochrome oxidase Cu insertion factor (SCO1/SenC/PrrC family)
MATTGLHPRSFKNAWRETLPALIVAAAVLVAGVAGFAIGKREFAAGSALPVIRSAPSYTLTNQLGESVASTTFSDKVQVVSFLFPYCTTLCPLIAAHFANFENLYLRPAGLADEVALVAFDIDPADTGPREMRAFMKEYGWDPKDRHWQFLTGSPGEISRVVRDGFAVPYQRLPLASEKGIAGPQIVQPEIVNQLAAAAHPDFDIMHDDVIEVVDGHGRIRQVYETADTVGGTRLLRVVNDLLAERD